MLIKLALFAFIVLSLIYLGFKFFSAHQAYENSIHETFEFKESLRLDLWVYGLCATSAMSGISLIYVINTSMNLILIIALLMIILVTISQAEQTSRRAAALSKLDSFNKSQW